VVLRREGPISRVRSLRRIFHARRVVLVTRWCYQEEGPQRMSNVNSKGVAWDMLGGYDGEHPKVIHNLSLVLKRGPHNNDPHRWK
jgi:hypothetical protein